MFLVHVGPLPAKFLDDCVLLLDDALPHPLQERLVRLSLVELLPHELGLDEVDLLLRVAVVQLQDAVVLDLGRDAAVAGRRVQGEVLKGDII